MVDERLIAVRQGLQGEHLAALMRPHRDSIRDGMPQELIQRSAFHGILGQIAVFGIALQQPLAFQKTSDALTCMDALMPREAGCRKRP